MSELYDKVEKFVEDSFANGRHTHTVIHLKLAKEAAQELRPDADEAILIAAVGHDVDRAFFERPLKAGEYKDEKYLKAHQESSANIIAKFLKENGAEDEFTKRVWHLISKHEEGGDEDQNLIKDADSLSYFRGNNSKQIAKKYPGVSLRGKIDWMYNRMTSTKAKELAKDLYEEDIKEWV